MSNRVFCLFVDKHLTIFMNIKHLFLVINFSLMGGVYTMTRLNAPNYKKMYKQTVNEVENIGLFCYSLEYV